MGAARFTPSSSPSVPDQGAGRHEREALKQLMKSSRALGPLTRRRIFPQFPGVPDGLRLGWAQLPSTRGQQFSLGLFADRRHFSQVAVADGHGRVFMGGDPAMDVHDMDAQCLFSRDQDVWVPARRMFGPRARADRRLRVVSGDIACRDADGQMMWLASWLKSGRRYTLEQTRAQLADEFRIDLEYRDALAVAFFAVYLIPKLAGLLMGFGSGNIFRRLNREAPIGAIRRSVRDTTRARASHLRSSGLEAHFADLMREAGALERMPGLEPIHGAEPLHLYSSPYSGSYFFAWHTGLEFIPALKALKIEGNLNRFAAVSAWLERNARHGAYPTEDTVKLQEAAQIDFALLTNPALAALDLEKGTQNGPDGRWHGVDPVHDDATAVSRQLVDTARHVARDMRERHGDPAAQVRADGRMAATAEPSEWIYRQTLASLLRRLRLPYRYDVEFRSDLHAGNVALAFTTAGVSMMPSSRYDERRRGWVGLSERERASMSADYNLRVGLMMAALAFGADDHVREVSLHIDSIGLEEAVAEQSGAVAKLMSQALETFERIRTGNVTSFGSKAGPKDGDVHGDPSHVVGGRSDDDADDDADDGRNHGDAAGGSAQASASQGSISQEDVNAAFRQLMNGVNLTGGETRQGGGAHAGDGTAAGTDDTDTEDEDNDEADEARDVSEADDADDVDGDADDLDDADDGDADDRGDDDDDDAHEGDGRDGDGEHVVVADSKDVADLMATLRRNPTVRNMVTVTFTREVFLAELARQGMRDPKRFYGMFDASMHVDDAGGLRPVDAEFNLRDNRFSPAGAQEEPELSDAVLPTPVARILGARDAAGLSIQRADVLQQAVGDFHRLAQDDSSPSVDRARRAMDDVNRIGDPELSAFAPQVTSALIDGRDTPDGRFTLSKELDQTRLKVRDMLFSGQVSQGVALASSTVDRMDAMFAGTKGVPRYFNSYAERVVYNRLFSTPGETTVLIPDNLFYAHMELADLLTQLKDPDRALKHLNRMVAYAPTYPLSHLKLAVQLADREDWDSARAATLNALWVALDRDDASFAYYRFAYAAWMRDEFDVAVAAYVMSNHISSGRIPSLSDELDELVHRADSQCIPIPRSVSDAQKVLQAYGLPVWPHTQVASIVRKAARVCVDQGMFVPARTLSVAAARMNDEDYDGIDAVQAQFIRSLNA